MLKIKEVVIRNFRSIVEQRISTNDMNLFVGLNDVGKSNILKALNLFFNGMTDIDTPFNFEVDFSKTSPLKVKKAKEITISLIIEVPNSYADGGLVVWKKTWRRDSEPTAPYYDRFAPVGKQLGSDDAFSPRSKTPTALRKIKYYYIPAIKGADYFKHLLGNLYVSASSQADSFLMDKSKEYSQALQEFTQRISEIVKEKLNIDSVLSMPEDQMDIFRELTFGTKDLKKNSILLNHRGDGVKARHIPAILKFIQEQEVKASMKSIPYTIIWGYEEPENGVEMLKCFDLANELLSYSDEIQLFITTHSPAFYTLSGNSSVRVFSVTQTNDSCATIIEGGISVNSLNETIGLMPVVAPYIQEQVRKVSQLRTLFNNSPLLNCDTVFVEGKTDKSYLESAIEVFSQKLRSKIQNGNLRIVTKDDGGGVGKLRDWVFSWCYLKCGHRLFVLFDSDDAGKKMKREITEDNIYIACEKKPKIDFIKPSPWVKLLFESGVYIPFAIEHLFPILIWQIAKQNHFLSKMDIPTLRKILLNGVLFDFKISEVIDNLQIPTDIKDTILTHVVHKDKISNLVI